MLDKKFISKYQSLSIDFIKSNLDLIDLESLSLNKRFNKPGTVQVVNTAAGWFIIEPPLLGDFSDVNFLSVDSLILI